ncbi:MAG: polysaccharide deacetylase family protein [Sedimentisphaerales bacterium]|nr:polysaccharide deacetylase family protein [Sedimentisphaerales bacterium]
MLALTFDDGPSDNLTLAIMDLLDKYNAKASFFLLGRNIAGRENIVKQISVRGHDICSHGFDHLNYLKISPWCSIKDIKKGWDAIDSALGIDKEKYLFRPPYGKLNIVSLAYLLLKKVHVVYWTDDSGDSWKTKPSSDRVAKLIDNSLGAVILNHDFNRREKQTESWVLESVRLALEKAKEKNMSIVTVSQLN